MKLMEKTPAKELIRVFDFHPPTPSQAHLNSRPAFSAFSGFSASHVVVALATASSICILTVDAPLQSRKDRRTSLMGQSYS